MSESEYSWNKTHCKRKSDIIIWMMRAMCVFLPFHYVRLVSANLTWLLTHPPTLVFKKMEKRNWGFPSACTHAHIKHIHFELLKQKQKYRSLAYKIQNTQIVCQSVWLASTHGIRWLSHTLKILLSKIRGRKLLENFVAMFTKDFSRIYEVFVKFTKTLVKLRKSTEKFVKIRIHSTSKSCCGKKTTKRFVIIE